MASVYAFCTVCLRIKLTQPWSDTETGASFRASSVRACTDAVDKLVEVGRNNGILVSVESPARVGGVVSQDEAD